MGEKVKAKRKREIDNALKINKRRKRFQALSNFVSLFQNLGGEPSDEMYRPEEEIPQITSLAYDSLVEYVPKKLQPVQRQLCDSMCFRGEALEIVEQFLKDSE